MNPFNPLSVGCQTGTYCVYPAPQPAKETQRQVAQSAPASRPPSDDISSVLIGTIVIGAVVAATVVLVLWPR